MIARRRSAEKHNAAEAISAEHTARRIRDDLDRKMNVVLSKIQKYVDDNFPVHELEFENRKSELRLRSMADKVELGMIVVEGVSAEALRMRPPSVVGDPDLAIRINRSLLGEMANANEQELQEVARAAVESLKSGRAAQVAKKALKAGEDEQVQFRLEPDWLIIDYSRTRYARATSSNR
jgi:hypothetical protein